MALNRQAFSRVGNAPDLLALAPSVRAVIGDPFYVSMQTTAGVLTVFVEKPSVWSGADTTSVQNVVTAAVDRSARTEAQDIIDAMPIFEQAILLTLLDQINVIRAALPTPLGAVTPAQAINAVRTKAGTL